MKNVIDEEAGVRELRMRAAVMEPPPLAHETLARVLARRAAGERLTLHTSDDSAARNHPVARSIAIGLVALAASIVAAVMTRKSIAVGDAEPFDHSALAAVDLACASTPSTSRDSSTLRHLMISAFGIAAACGAELGQDAPIAFRASQIESGTFTYSSVTITDGVFTSTHPSSSIAISRTTWNGTPAILAVREGPPMTGVHLDSLVVSADGPTPLYWASIYKTQHPGGAIHAVFDSATISIVMTGHLDTTATLSFHMKSGQLPFGFALALDVPALPLTEGWHGTIEIAPPIHPRAFKYFERPWESISLRVVGRETIRVAAGPFDCWKVQVGEPADDSFIWVSAENHVVIRSVMVTRFSDTSFEDRHDLERMVLVTP
ncbi:MAG: hypothetical protein ABIQ10_00665 [Gemmatimonadaceae bacterium]